MSDLSARIGQRIRALRTERRLTQKELARRAEIAAPNLNRIEKGQKGLSMESLERLAGALGVQPAELLRDPTEEPDVGALVEALLARLPADPEARELRIRRALLALLGR